MPPGGTLASTRPSVAGRALSGVTSTLTSPLLTGTLLYLLTRGPPHLRSRLLKPFQSTHPVTTNTPRGVARLTALITLLKLLTAANALRAANRALNALAWNNWALGRSGAAWRFGPGKAELVLITGGSSGFGYHMVQAFAGHARVVAVDVAAFPAELEGLSDVFFYRCDIADTAALEGVCARIRREHGDVSVLVNNAGIGIGKTLLETSNAESQKLLQVNLISHLVLIRAFLPSMLRARKGHIVSIASMASFVAAPGLVDYSISKIGALYLTEGVRAECLAHYAGGRAICTTSVHPSWHQTGILKDSGKQLAKRGIVPDPPERVAEAVLQQVLAGRSGRVCVPRGQERWAGVRGWPRWVQDVVFGLVGRGGVVSFAEEKEGGGEEAAGAAGA
ncbi:hypothetical protein C7974DRAFT_441407 [Boeremia exigua]|uniref:uncharacterized protein n=1 Tax=Boeremia exigua TaxID=749465 RepID=UPI001E8D3812|nr:uncharacterized protein C7974DRAFT_441407 [Boeremia exigua]KAH6618844.1 hypothetical protein C7974DRAFT_441407 [Boeremia exigua]